MKILLVTLVLMAPLAGLCDTLIKGSIDFNGRPPLVGIIYVPSNEVKPAVPVIDQIDKTFTHKMVVVSQGEKVVFNNSDAVEHNVFANDANAGARFDVGLMKPGGQRHVAVGWKDGALVRVGCKIHPRMRTYLATINTQHYQILEFDKSQRHYEFSLEVPDDAQSIILRIPKYDDVTVDISEGTLWQHPIIKMERSRGQLTLKKAA